MKDITEPGVKTTFKVHCPAGRKVEFEVLKMSTRKKADVKIDNKPSGYFIRGDPKQDSVAANKKDARKWDSYFILLWWRGSVVGIENKQYKKWVVYSDNSEGAMLSPRIVHNKKLLTRYPIPSFIDTFTVEIGLFLLYCIVLHYIVLYCIALYCIVLHYIVLHCIVLYCIVLYFIVLY